MDTNHGGSNLDADYPQQGVNVPRLTTALANGEEVRIAGFGTFAAKTRAARTGRNPQTGEAISISASKSPSFKAGKALRDAVNAERRS